jgi:preprotein translocase subunit SecB
MEAKLSPLALKEFVVINSNYKFINIEDDIDVNTLFATYSINIDFAIAPVKDFQQVFIKALINQEEKQGYSIFAEGVAIFSLNNTEELSEEQKVNLLQYSTVSIALNSLRGFIINLTSVGPCGKYILPSIDVNDLFKQKVESVKKTKKVEATKKKAIGK